MVGNSIRENMIRVYSLDRVLEIQPTEKAFKYPADFSPEIYFEGYFGVIHDEGYALENVKLKVRADQANYLRSLPMHHSEAPSDSCDTPQLSRGCSSPSIYAKARPLAYISFHQAEGPSDTT
jgi:hypothetical protein